MPLSTVHFSLFSRLRTRLLLLILMAALPVLALTFYANLKERQSAANAIEETASRVARLVSFDEQRLVEATRQLLVTMTWIPQVRSRDTTACSALLATLHEQFPHYANLGVIELDGSLSCSALPFDTPVNLSDRLYFQNALQTRDFAIGEYQVGRITNRPSINFSYPVMDADEVQAVAFAALDLSWFNQLAAEAQLPSDSTLTVIDHNGIILARYPESDGWIGRPVLETTLGQTVLREQEGVATAIGLDNVQRIYGFLPLEGDPENSLIYLSVGIPEQHAYAEANNALVQNLTGLALIFGAAFIAAWFASDLFILRPVNTLIAAAGRISAGDLSARSLLERELNNELGELGRSFDTMAASLEMREKERDRAEARLRASEAQYRSLYEAMSEGVALHKMIYNAAGEPIDYLLLDVNPAYEAITGLKRGQVIGRRATEVYQTNLAPYIETYAEVAASGQALNFETFFPPMDKHFSISAFSADRGYFATVFVDITGRKEAEATLRRYNRRLQNLHAIDRAILAAQTAEDVARLALRYFMQQVPIMNACVTAFNFENQEGIVYAVQEKTKRQLPAEKHFPITAWPEEDISRLQQGGIQVIENAAALQQVPPGLQLLRAKGVNAFLRVPLIIQDRLIGSFSLGAASPGDFATEYVEIAREIGDQLAIAIEHNRLQDQIKRHAAELEQQVIERTAQLQQTKDRVEAILNSTSDAIILASYDGVIQQVNPGFGEMFGYTSDDVFGHSLLSLAAPICTETMLQTLYTLVKDKQPNLIDITARRKDGSTFTADIAVAPIQEAGTIQGIVCSLRDMTVRAQMEAGLREALEKERDLNELKSRFVSMVSHELRNPLTTIMASTELVQKYSNRMTEEKKRIHFDRVKSQIYRLTDLLNDILELSKAESVGLAFNPEIFDLERFCRGIAEELQLTARDTHHIAFTSTGQCSKFVGDKKLLHHILANLLSNAIKYSPGGGLVQFDLVCEALHVHIHIHDTGMGIPPEDQKHLFQTFFRARNVGSIQGTGLGLVIIKHAVEAHGGSIAFNSEVGVGTSFTIQLPVFPVAQLETPATN